MNNTIATGVVFGRFQPFHNGHLKFVLAGKQRCSFLVIGITNPDPSTIVIQQACPHRSEPRANPFSYYERAKMVVDSLQEAGLGRDEFTVVPFPINRPELIRHYTPPDAIYFVVDEDDWGHAKLEILRKLNLNVEVLAQSHGKQSGVRGTDIRRKIANGEPWVQLIPPAAARVIEEMKLDQRLVRLYGRSLGEV